MAKKKTSYAEDRRYRDVRKNQSMDRGLRGTPSKPYLWVTGASVVGILIGFATYYVFQALLNARLFFKRVAQLHTIQGYVLNWHLPFNRYMWLATFGAAFLGGLIVGYHFYITWKSNNEHLVDTDINFHEDDNYIMFVDEMLETLDWFPDAGAHSSVSPSSLVSHVILTNRGLKKKVDMYKRYDKDGLVDGTMHYKNEIKIENGQRAIESVDIIDTQFGQDLLTDSEIPLDRKDLRKGYRADLINYNPIVDSKRNRRKYREKLNYDTVANLIQNDWELPLYEVQRPGGAYLVDTAPVNTMILAITRAGKGQTYIEPLIDIWTREKRQNNIIINDPKGELTRKFFIPAVVRGYDFWQFNLINYAKTDISNPLGPAISAAREGDFAKASSIVDNVGDIFFPKDTGEEPMWANAANNAFRRSVFGLIDYFLEEEVEMRHQARKEDWNEAYLETQLDELWGKVTLYNAYRFFITLASRTISVPKNKEMAYVEVDTNPDSIYHIGDKGSPVSLKYREELEAYKDKMNNFENRSASFNQKAAPPKKPTYDVEDRDMLTHFFDATSQLPRNTLRTFVQNTDQSLRAMAGSERTISSVYGITLTAMNFFTDPRVSALTSGRPSQCFDNESLSFPRRVGVRFSPEYLQRYRLIGCEAVWRAYSDIHFKNQLDPKLFYHEQMIDRIGWAMFYFDGKFSEHLPNNSRFAYLKLDVRNPKNGYIVKTFYFELEITYKRTVDGRYYLKAPIINQKIIHDGILREIKPGNKDKSLRTVIEIDSINFSKAYKPGDPKQGEPIKQKVLAIAQTKVKYTEKPKILTLISPPHLLTYAKLFLIAIKQMVDINFDSSYITKKSQKPLYKTRFMFDELGNLSSEGHGIYGLETLLSIGLGQDQQFTLILQTLQQLRSVYGNDSDKIIQGNTNNIVFLKSTDTDMIDQLVKLSGVRHESSRSKTISKNNENIFERNDTRVQYGMSLEEVPVIKANDFISLPPMNSIVFRAGSSPIWNRNETILPMSFSVLGNPINIPGREEYSLLTLPSNSSTLDFNVISNTPDFFLMLKKRCSQARLVGEVERDYLRVHHRSTDEIERQRMYSKGDVDLTSSMIMKEINSRLMKESAHTGTVIVKGKSNDEFNRVYTMAQSAAEKNAKKTFAGGRIHLNQLMSETGSVYISSPLRNVFAKALMLTEVRRAMMRENRPDYAFNNEGVLVNSDGEIMAQPAEKAINDFKNEMNKKGNSVMYEYKVDDVQNLSQDMVSYIVEDAFVEYLASQESWSHIGGGKFEQYVSQLYDLDFGDVEEFTTPESFDAGFEAAM